MIRRLAGLLAALGLSVSLAQAAVPLDLNLSTDTNSPASQAWPVMPPLPQPTGLRPCCAFGYDLHAEVMRMPVPLYQLDNVVTADNLGRHQYNDHFWAGLANLAGMGSENNGLLYTQRGGFVDTAHVRDTADNTVFIFTHLLPKLGQAFTLDMGSELADRRLVFSAFTPPTQPGERYALAAWMAAHLAFQLAEWHEIAQWYGFQSVPGFSEGVSAFSPEDLYSNLLGARLAASLIMDGQTASQGMYNAAMNTMLPQALARLGVQSAAITRFHFDMLDGRWWNSQRRVPEKFLVLRRNYLVDDNRVPTPVPGEQTPPKHLMLPHRWQSFDLDTLTALQLWPGDSMANLPVPAICYTAKDFSRLAAFAKTQDQKTLASAVH